MPLQEMLNADMSLTTLIHFTFRRGTQYERTGSILQARDNWAIACAPNLMDPTASQTPARGPWHRTNEPRAVTCPACLQSDIFKKLSKRISVEDDLVDDREVIHFSRDNKAACLGKATHRSDDVRAVTCPECKKTPIFNQQAARARRKRKAQT